MKKTHTLLLTLLFYWENSAAHYRPIERNWVFFTILVGGFLFGNGLWKVLAYWKDWFNWVSLILGVVLLYRGISNFIRPSYLRHRDLKNAGYDGIADYYRQKG